MRKFTLLQVKSSGTLYPYSKSYSTASSDRCVLQCWGLTHEKFTLLQVKSSGTLYSYSKSYSLIVTASSDGCVLGVDALECLHCCK